MGEGQALYTTVTQPTRCRAANTKPFNPAGEHVTYWMQASQRVHENPALAYAVELANTHSKPLLVCFGVTAYPGAQQAHYDFMLEGLAEVALTLSKRNIPFILKQQHPVDLALSFNSCAIVTDENYTRTPRQWRERLAQEAPVQVIVVDANLIVPAATLGKEEYAAYTIRPKLWKVATTYLTETTLPKLKKSTNDATNALPKVHLNAENKAKRSVQLKGGEAGARAQLAQFIDKLGNYEQRNDPSQQVTSNLSAHLHFGMMSPVTIVNAISAAAATDKRIDATAQAFIEQVFVRREVAHNFTYYNPHYDSLAGCPQWARDSLDKHRGDKREYVYSLKELEQGKTHDELWNTAQHEMTRSGYMHNYLRMLWCKKILEWSETPEQAFTHAIALNDTYELDGRDANGYTGVAWSIGGKHDRAWFNRPVYGMVRYMSSDAAAKKFDVKKYTDHVESLKK